MTRAKEFFPGRGKMTELEVAAQERLADAEILLSGGRYDSAIAHAIYSVEIVLKVVICKRLDLDALPQAFEIHDLESLLYLTGLKRRLELPAWKSVKDGWTRITQVKTQEFLNQLRYRPGTTTETDAIEFLSCARDPLDGVIPWLLTQP